MAPTARSRRPKTRCGQGTVFTPTFRICINVVLAFFYLVQLSVLSNAINTNGVNNEVTLSNLGTNTSNIMVASRLGFGIAVILFLLLIFLIVLSWYDYQRFESYLLVSNSCLFGLTMGFLMSSYELLYSSEANPGLFAINFIIVMFLPTMDLMDLRPIASLGLEEGFNLMRRARDTKALSTAFDSISVTIDGEGDAEPDELEERTKGRSDLSGVNASRQDIEKRMRSVSALAVKGAMKSVDADTYYSPTGTESEPSQFLEDSIGSHSAHRQTRRTSRLSVSLGAPSSGPSSPRHGSSDCKTEELVSISFGAETTARDAPAWWNAIPPNQTADPRIGSLPSKPSALPLPSRAPEKVPEVSPPSSFHRDIESGSAPVIDPEDFDGFRLKLNRMPMSLYNPPAVQHDLSWDSFINIVHRIDSSSCHIYTALWEAANKQVIIKLIKADRVHIPMAVSEFESEATVLSRISHPHIVKLLGTGTQPRRFLVLELLDGGSLSHLLGLRPDAHNRVSRKRFSYLETLYLSRDLASALEYLHSSWHPIAHIVHRDLKPDNIGWTSDGTLKLFDFGLCTVIQANKTSHEGYKLTGNTGTLRYMAPEVAVGKPYHQSVDTYSYGIIVWQVLTGFVPFRDLGRKKYYERVVNGGARPPLDPALPTKFKSLLSRCWHHDQNERPHFREVVAILDELAAEREREEAEGWRYMYNQVTVGWKNMQRLIVQWRLLLLIFCTLLGCISIAAFDEGNVQSGVSLGVISSLGLYLFGISTIRAYIRNDGAKSTICGSKNGWREAAVVGLELGAASRRVRSSSGAGSDKKRLLGLGGWHASSNMGASTRGSEHHLYGVNF